MTGKTNCAVNTTILDFVTYDYPGEASNYKTLYALDYVKIVFLVLIMTGTLIGNLSIIIVIGLNKKMRKVVTNIYMANLALADLLVCSICMTTFLWKNILNNHIFILGPVMCKLIHFWQMTTLICSVLTLSAIACDRACAILAPMRNLNSKPRPMLVILAIWLVSISASLPLIFVRTLITIHFRNFLQENCGDTWPKAFDEKENKCKVLRWVPQFYYTFLSVTLFFLPVTIMIITYSLILWRLAQALPGETSKDNVAIQNRNRMKILKMVVTLLIVFVICWMPVQIIILYDKYRSDAYGGALPFWYEEAGRVTEFLAFSNSFLNPIIYFGFTKEFRDNLFRLLSSCGKRRRRFGSSGILQRFRTTLTTLSSSLRNTGRKDPRIDSRRRQEKSDPNEIELPSGKVHQDVDAQEKGEHKANEPMNDIQL